MWRHKLKNWENLNKDVYKFCFEQAEKRLKDVLDDSEKITSRAYALIGILIPILSVCVGLVVKSIAENKTIIDFSVYVSILCISVLGWCLYKLSHIIQVRNVWFSGTEPKDILLTKYVEIESLVDDEPIKYMYLSEMEIIQDKINNNKIINENRTKVFGKCLTVVIITTVATLASILSLTIL